MSSHEVLTEVPPHLKKLVKFIGRAFYQPQQIVVLDILAKYPCVTEVDLLDVLKMHGAQKQLRQVLTSLKKDKLIKSLQKMESEESNVEGQKHLRMVHYYYINYKQFVNVVKYRLDQMRRKLEMDEKKSQSHTSYKCPNCDKTFSDLDVDRLIDHATGSLRCSHCGCDLKEDVPEDVGVDMRQLISQMNAQLRPILDLLREVENINLASEVLEPEPRSIHQHLQSRGVVTAKHGGKHKEQNWATKQTVDLYGGDQAISVSIGSEEELNSQSKVVAKDTPEWMKYSTVHPMREDMASTIQPAAEAVAHKPVVPDQQIMTELLIHEGNLAASNVGPSGLTLGGHQLGEVEQYSSSSEEEEGGREGLRWKDTDQSKISDSSEEEEQFEQFTVKIGGRDVALNEVTDEMVAEMTEEERQLYTTRCQQAMSELY